MCRGLPASDVSLSVGLREDRVLCLTASLWELSRRLLLVEKHRQRLLVHAVAVRDAAAAQQADGADADHDAGQPPGGAKL